MAKTKQQTSSAAQRRDKQRQQRQQRLTSSPSKQTQARGRGPMQRKSGNRQWLFVGGVLVLIAAIIVGFIVISRLQSTANGPTPVDTTVFKAVTHVDPNVLAEVGSGNLKNPLQAIKGSPPALVGPTGKPEFFYAGGEFCPFCASERWAMIVALSRFGTFSHVNQIVSAEDSISTFTFYQSTYSSSYIDFVPVELEGNNVDSTGNYATLQTPTAAQQHLLNLYDAAPYTTQPGAIPFIDIANQYIEVGLAQGLTPQDKGFSPQDLMNSQWQDIANQLSDSNSTVSKDILGSANYLTAGICVATHQQPGSVCNTDVIQKIEQSLGKSAIGTGGAQIAVAGKSEAVMRRQE